MEKMIYSMPHHVGWRYRKDIAYFDAE